MDAMRAELLTIGSELLCGATPNTNATYLARRLVDVGIACHRQVTVDDDSVSIVRALQEALTRSDLVILTGGLGPTCDDMTIAAIAKAMGRSLIVHPATAASIRRFYARRHRTLQRAALRQAELPKGSIALPNRLGTAPGLWMSLARLHPRNPSFIVALPGVPAEMRLIMEQSVLPKLKQLRRSAPFATLTLRTAGVVELAIERVLKQLRLPSSVRVGLYPYLHTVDIQLTVSASSRQAAQALLQRIEERLRRKLGVAIYAMAQESLEQVVGRLLVSRHQTLAVAESCTGGLIGHHLTRIPGSSRYFRGSVIAYHNDLKRQLLGVTEKLLNRYGAVSEPVAVTMARKVRLVTGSDVGLSVTGIAGPQGATPTKPVGLVHFALADNRGSIHLRCQFIGDRDQIKAQAAQTALNWLRLRLLKNF